MATSQTGRRHAQFDGSQGRRAVRCADCRRTCESEVDAAAKAGLSVIVFTASGALAGATALVYAGGAAFGRTAGKLLNDRPHGKSMVRVFRTGVGVGEENARYNGLAQAIKGTDIKIGAEIVARFKAVASS